MTLHIENKFFALDTRCSQLLIQRRFLIQRKPATAFTRCCVGLIECQQRARSATGGNQKIPPRQCQALGVTIRFIMGETVCRAIHIR